MSNHRYPKNCDKILKSLDEAGRHTLALKMFAVFFTYMGSATLRIYICQSIQSSLTDCMRLNWHSDINESPRCDSYKE